MLVNLDNDQGQQKQGESPSPYNAETPPPNSAETPPPYSAISQPYFTTSTTTTPTTQQYSGDTWFRRHFDLGWMKKPLGRLKLSEWVGVIFCLVCNACTYHASSTGFYWFVTTFSESAITFTLFLYLWKIYHRLPTSLTSNIMWFGLSASGFLVFLAASIGMLAGYPWADGRSAARAAGFFGLVVCAMFLIETCYYFSRMRTHGREARSGVDAMISEDVKAEQGEVDFFCCF